MINASNDFMKAMLSPQRKLFLKLEIYNSKMEYIKDITKQVKSDIGTLNVNGDSPIRRSFSLSLDNSLGEFIFGEENLIWIDKRIKLFLGLQSWNSEIDYIPQGLFILTEPEDNHTSDGKTASINAVDKAYLMTGNRGKFVNEQVIETGTSIVSAIKIIASHVGETLFNFDDVIDTVPYELTYGGEDNRWNALQELAELAKCTIFYDVYGFLRLKKIDLNSFENEAVTWEYKYGDKKEKFYAGNVRRFDENNLANHIRVLGGNGDTATVTFDLTVDETDPVYGHLWVNHPYSIQKIGKVSYFHNNNSPDPLIIDNAYALYRAKFELMNRLGFAENVQLSILANYLHDVDDVIWIEDNENGITGSKYLIKSISLPLAPSVMSMEVVRYRRVISDWDSIM